MVLLSAFVRSEWMACSFAAVRVALGLVSLLAIAGTAHAQSAVFGAQLDNTIFNTPQICTFSQTVGWTGCLSNGVGPHIIVSDDPTNGSRRGLIQFDVAGTPQTGGPIPAGSTITSVVLRIHMSQVSNVNLDPPGNVAIKPLAQSWGEGPSNSGGEGSAGSGAPAQTDDATWVHRFFDTTNWNHPGGSCRPSTTACASAAASATTDIQVVAPAFVTWDSTPQLVSDVQGWLDTPSSNNGWMVQALNLPARFDSSEIGTPGLEPILTVDYTLPPSVANDACDTPTVVAALPFADSLDTLPATADQSDPLPPCGTGADGATVWYSVTWPSAEILEASTEGSDYDTVLSVWDAAGGCLRLSNVACDDDAGVGTTSRVSFQATAGNPYRIMVGDRNQGSGGNLEFGFISMPQPASTGLLLAALSTLGALRRRSGGTRLTRR